jgi:thiol-disulfide isomerase/thioredoxin
MNMSPPNLRTALLAAMTLILSATVSFAAAPKVGDAFPPLSDAKLEGTLPDTKGKILLVDFWASWCAPCRLAFPALKDIAEKYKDKGVLVIGVSIDEEKADMDAFVRKTAPNFTIVRDDKATLADQLNVPTMPSTYLVDGEGKIAAIHAGFEGEATVKKYIAEIERLLAKR